MTPINEANAYAKFFPWADGLAKLYLEHLFEYTEDYIKSHSDDLTNPKLISTIFKSFEAKYIPQDYVLDTSVGIERFAMPNGINFTTGLYDLDFYFSYINDAHGKLLVYQDEDYNLDLELKLDIGDLETYYTGFVKKSMASNSLNTNTILEYIKILLHKVEPTLSHELVHYLQVLRNDNSITDRERYMKKLRDAKACGYLNKGCEYPAHLKAFLNKVQQKAEQKKLKWNDFPLKTIVELLKYDPFFRKLTKENKRKVLSMLAYIYQQTKKGQED